jgi:hypothetical protein
VQWGLSTGYAWDSRFQRAEGDASVSALRVVASGSFAPLHWSLAARELVTALSRAQSQLSSGLAGGLAFDLGTAAWLYAEGELLRSQASSWRGLGGVGVRLSQTTQLQLSSGVIDEPATRRRLIAMLSLSGPLGVADKDGDSISDEVDACPGDEGTTRSLGCPFVDADADDVEDGYDACPDRPGPIDNAGCPLRDRDNDGTPDIDDFCPETAACQAEPAPKK